MTPLEIAAGGARGFQVLQCVECAENIKKALQAAGHRGTWIEIRGKGSLPFMVCLSFEGGAATITQNGKHVGIRVGDMVFDNLHPTGMSYAEWLRDFDAVGGVEVVAGVEF